MDRLGNAAYLGTADDRAGERGRLDAAPLVHRAVGVRPDAAAVLLPARFDRPGRLQVRFRLSTERPDLPADRVLPCAHRDRLGGGPRWLTRAMAASAIPDGRRGPAAPSPAAPRPRGCRWPRALALGAAAPAQAALPALRVRGRWIRQRRARHRVRGRRHPRRHRERTLGGRPGPGLQLHPAAAAPPAPRHGGDPGRRVRPARFRGGGARARSRGAALRSVGARR